MNYYVEITLLPNFDINLFSLWSKAFQQIHLGLVEMQDEQKRVPIGISFPEYKIGEKFGVLGSKCRMFADDEATLTRFNAPNSLKLLSDYVHCTGIRPVPVKLLGQAVYRRRQPKTNPERLARRYAKRHDLDFETALNTTVQVRPEGGDACYPTAFRYCEMPRQSVALPFIRLKSLSTEQPFCLWIEKSSVAEPVAGGFSCYGLSARSTVPEF
ncbi:type I-F CRISPR-associated endoribonuclease Cas6/Csy4 [Candidatus Methylomicrobium oryzae]|jgi:CRISPR-associated endonuclease Csy4|uniref:type I-F CRISPR-associated endoribonuclease Cas6/Csy4 n=1 Tax=Candidatus Methylomicrobium oryzae TaxID=2802053 RepID=UPI001922A9AE|nr:type I-F CRISPR-associated endoribonuclease Cas6/Csy4 [Methylomicrobium sp. RS1]MBL1263023.1 type I-F CRISPR-associated endoribonuclease Cas6/Csy4 [Methylomicrobium sp. RS1]